MHINLKLLKISFPVFFLFIFISSCTENQQANGSANISDTSNAPIPDTTEAKILGEPKVIEETKPDYTYSKVSRKEWYKQNDSLLTDSAKQILADINRVDLQHLLYQDSIIVPSNFEGQRKTYLPFPLNVDALSDIDKIIFFSYPTQTFSAYEKGMLVATGPTNMGRKNKPTPTGLFFTNWKAKESVSTVSDEWILKWNFNVANFAGVGFHQYSLPGYPASHSCLRLQENDAKFLYYWANQWTLKNGKVIVPGTPVIIYGAFPFGEEKPWHNLLTDPKVLDISREALLKEVEPFREKILETQRSKVEYAKAQVGITSTSP
jgi:lipoprotein-anchoring transpeptidase ErfK/SrfK